MLTTSIWPKKLPGEEGTYTLVLNFNTPDALLATSNYIFHFETRKLMRYAFFGLSNFLCCSLNSLTLVINILCSKVMKRSTLKSQFRDFVSLWIWAPLTKREVVKIKKIINPGGIQILDSNGAQSRLYCSPPEVIEYLLGIHEPVILLFLYIIQVGFLVLKQWLIWVMPCAESMHSYLPVSLISLLPFYYFALYFRTVYHLSHKRKDWWAGFQSFFSILI